MAKNRTFKGQKPARPFEGKVNQLKREKLVLCSMLQFEGFKQALGNAHIEYELGDFYKDGIIIVKK